MRYENPLYMAEDAAVADLIADGRLQLGISRGSPEPALAGYEAFGHVPRDGEDAAGMARRHTLEMLAAIDGGGVARPDPRQSLSRELLPIQPQAPGLRERIWWGAGSRATAAWAAQQGMNLMSSTLLTEETGQSLADLQAEQIEVFRTQWKAAGWQREPRISVSRSVMPVFDDLSHRYFGVHAQAESRDQVGYIDGGLARFGRSYTGDPARIAAELAQDAAVTEADLLLVTVPNQLGVDFNVHILESFAKYVAPSLGWKPNTEGPVQGYAI